MRRSTRSSSPIATFAYSTFSTDAGSSPICCTSDFAAAMGFRISCAIVEVRSEMSACFSVWNSRFSRCTSRATAGSKYCSLRRRAPKTPM